MIISLPEGLGKVSENGMAPWPFGGSVVNFMLRLIEFR